MTLRLVLHAPTPGALTRARSNARNLRKAVPDAGIEIVVNAAAVATALAEPDPSTDDLLRLCANSLSAKGLAPGPHRTVVAAVLHIAQRQNNGWAYMRA
jgi:NitT/TauT family transport system ATP-binding protein